MGNTLSPESAKANYLGMKETAKLWKTDYYRNQYWLTEGMGLGIINPADDLHTLIMRRRGLTPEHLELHTVEDLNKKVGKWFDSHLENIISDL